MFGLFYSGVEQPPPKTFNEKNVGDGKICCYGGVGNNGRDAAVTRTTAAKSVWVISTDTSAAEKTAAAARGAAARSAAKVTAKQRDKIGGENGGTNNDCCDAAKETTSHNGSAKIGSGEIGG